MTDTGLTAMGNMRGEGRGEARKREQNEETLHPCSQRAFYLKGKTPSDQNGTYTSFLKDLAG